MQAGEYISSMDLDQATSYLAKLDSIIHGKYPSVLKKFAKTSKVEVIAWIEQLTNQTQQDLI